MGGDQESKVNKSKDVMQFQVHASSIERHLQRCGHSLLVPRGSQEPPLQVESSLINARVSYKRVTS